MHMIYEWFHHPFNYLADFWLTDKISNIKTPLAPISKCTSFNLFVKYVNDGLTFINGKDVLDKNCRGDQLERWTEILLSQTHVPDMCDITTHVKGGWEIGKTHSTIDNMHKHFTRTEP